MAEEQSRPISSLSSMTESSPAENTKSDEELDTAALKLGWNNRENVWTATARFLRALSVFQRSLWAWLNNPVIALLAGILANAVLVCIIIRPGGSWYSAAYVLLYVAGFQIAWQVFLGWVGTKPRPPYLQMIRYTSLE